MKLIDGKMVFDSGRVLDPPFCQISLDVTLEGEYGAVLGGGHDESYHVYDPDYSYNQTQALKPAECVDLADFMIERWAAFRDMHALQPALGTLARDLNE